MCCGWHVLVCLVVCAGECFFFLQPDRAQLAAGMSMLRHFIFCVCVCVCVCLYLCVCRAVHIVCVSVGACGGGHGGAIGTISKCESLYTNLRVQASYL